LIRRPGKSCGETDHGLSQGTVETVTLRDLEQNTENFSQKCWYLADISCDPWCSLGNWITV